MILCTGSSKPAFLIPLSHILFIPYFSPFSASPTTLSALIPSPWLRPSSSHHLMPGIHYCFLAACPQCSFLWGYPGSLLTISGPTRDLLNHTVDANSDVCMHFKLWRALFQPASSIYDHSFSNSLYTMLILHKVAKMQ